MSSAAASPDASSTTPDPPRGRFGQWLGRWWKGIAGFILALVVGIGVGYVIWGVSRSQSKNDVVAPDTSPGEYLYLDGKRVHSYLSQIVDGLADTEKHTLADTEELSAEIKTGAAGLSGKRSQTTSSEAQIKPTPADRFYLLLRLLRKPNFAQDSPDLRPWLFELQAEPTDGAKSYEVYDAACQVREGDFVRIHNAHLSVPPYAAVLPKATYAVLYRQGLAAPDKRLFAPHNKVQKRRIRRYQHLLGKDPRLPFIVRTVRSSSQPVASPSTSPAGGQTQPTTTGQSGGQASPSKPVGPRARITFFVPALYSALRDEPSLISGTLNIVGKVVYRNLSRAVGGKRIDCHGQPVRSTVPKKYVDRKTVATFAPAIHASTFIFNNLRFSHLNREATRVTANMTLSPPVMVVVPIAMYQ